jgi:predicted DCC family thiol-disulfide oxidoreductase YuxK
MKKKTNYYLIYDTECPLCQCYTRGFVQLGFLTPSGRIAYHEALVNLKGKFDELKAKNRIALVSESKNQTFYGIDALLELLNTKIPFIKRIGQFKPIKFLLDQLYDFISYNRKIIAPSKHVVACSCEPSVSYYWRFIFVLVNMTLFSYLLGTVDTRIISPEFILALCVSTVIVFSKYLRSFRIGIRNRDFYQLSGTVSLVCSLILLLTKLLMNLIF